MRISVRLKGIWASALIASFAVIQTPATTHGQTAAAPAASITAASSTTGEISQNEAAKKLLLRARQALAHSNLPQAVSFLEQASATPADYDALGDSPTTIQALIDRHNQLAAMAQQQDSQYNAGAASFFLLQAEALLYYHDFDNAETLIKHARKFDVEFNDRIGDPDRLEKLLEISRQNFAQTPPAVGDNQSATAEAKKLLSMAKLAYDKGQLNEAIALVNDVKKLKVDETKFAANEIRSWQLELKIQQALGTAATFPETAGVAKTVKFDSAVQPTQFESFTDNNVQQAGYDPSKDTTKNIQVGLETDDDSGNTGDAFEQIPATPMDFFQAGMKALANQKSAEARNYLTRAWEGRQQLDDVTRQSLQDQLTRLTAEPADAQSASANLQGRSIQEIQAFRKLQSEVFAERVAADKLIEKSPRQALEKMAMIRNQIGQSELDAAAQSPLMKLIDRDMERVQKYIDANLADIENKERNDENRSKIDRRRQRRADVERQLQSLVEQYNQLIDEQRFAEAEVIAQQGIDLAPKSEVAVLLLEKVRLQKAISIHEYNKIRKESTFLAMMQAADFAAGSSLDIADPIVIEDPERFTQNSERRQRWLQRNKYRSEAEALIWNRLKNQQVQGEYRGSLNDAMEQLATTSGVNIIMDEIALSQSQVASDKPLDVRITSPISLQSAMEIILQQKGLVYEVDNEVIKVTTPEAKSTKLEQETYYIGDLVMPLDTPRNPMALDWMSPERSLGAMGGSMNIQNVSVSQPPNQLAAAQQLGSLPSSGNPLVGGFSNNGPQRGTPYYNTPGSRQLGGVSLNDFTPLINLITQTIDSDLWDDTATLEPYVQNLSLVVSAPQATQDRIQDLFRRLRELNDVQIVVEVRFVTLTDTFFERVGIDFDFSLNDDSAGVVTSPTGDLQLAGGGSGVVGSQPIDQVPFAPTTDFDIQFLQGNFGAAEPLFGGFDAASAASIGFAILSDIEVFFLLQASKGNTRTNITQAPVVTMFNGQSASISDFAQQPFVTSVIPVVGDFAVAHQPVITLIPNGTNLNVQAVVSSDRQFVRLRLVPYFTEIQSVDTFTFNGSQETEATTNSVLDDLLDIVDGSADAGDEELLTRTTGITVQQPVVGVTNVSTVVSVPDGGTVLLGGIKRISEGRSEEGVPFLSNIPYVNRLFRNVGIGQDTQHLMLMVTPRIIIQTEIAEDTVGASSN